MRLGLALFLVLSFAAGPLAGISFAESTDVSASDTTETNSPVDTAENSVSSPESTSADENTSSSEENIAVPPDEQDETPHDPSEEISNEAAKPEPEATPESEAVVAPDVQLAATTDPTLYVSATGNDLLGDGSRAKPFATLAQAVVRADATVKTTVVVLNNLAAIATAPINAKNIVVRGEDSVRGTTPTISVTLALNLFAVTTGSLTLENVVVDGASSLLDHRAVSVTGTSGSCTLGAGAVIRNWYVSGATGAVRVRANGGSFIMKSGSKMENCQLTAATAGAGGAAVSVSAARDIGTGTTPSVTNRASFVMEGGASLVNCDTVMTANATFSGGGAVHATDTDITVQSGAAITQCDLTYRSVLGALIDASGTRQGGGAFFAANCKISMAGTIDDCHMVTAENTGTGNFYAGGGALFVYAYGCSATAGVDCRTNVSGVISNCTALSGGGAFYWSEGDGYGQGDNLWVGASGPLTSADQVIAKVYDTFEVQGRFEGCSTYDTHNTRSATLTSYTDYERFGIGGGAVCGAYYGLIVLDDGAVLQSCTTGSEGGGVSNYGVSVFCLDSAADAGGPMVAACSSGGIAGGICTGAASSIENVTVKNCSAGSLGGGLYIYSGSTTLYDCDISECTAGVYGGGIMQHVVHDLFMYGGSITNNHAESGGGLALVGHAGGTLTAPRGLSFNYPVSLNGGYTNPAYYKSSILTNKIGAPVVVAGNTQGTTNAVSNVWTPSVYPTTRISASGNFSVGSKLGITIADGSSSYNKTRTQFGNVSQPGLDLSSFSSDADSTLAAVYSGSNLYWADGFTVTYQANAPSGTSVEGEVPFDGRAGVPNAYPRAGGIAVVLDASTLTAPGYVFRGWSLDTASTTAAYVPGVSLSYSSAIDPDADGRIILYAVWQKIDYVCQIIRDTSGDGIPDTFHQAYTSISAAFADAQSSDRIELLKDAPLVDFGADSGSYPADGVVQLVASMHGVVLTTAPATQSVTGAQPWQGAPASSAENPIGTITRTNAGTIAARLVVAGGLSVRSVTLDGACTPAQAQVGAGVQAQNALIEVTGSASSLVLDADTTVRNACNVTGFGGGVYLAAGAKAVVRAGAMLAACTAGASGGGAFVDTTASCTLSGGTISGNLCTAKGTAQVGIHVGGIGIAAFAGGTPSVSVSGDVVVSGNVGRALGSTALSQAIASDIEVAMSGSAWSLAVLTPGLGAGASLGITSADPTLLTSGARFATAVGGSIQTSNLDTFFNDNDRTLTGTAGAGEAVVWQPPRVDVSFTKVGGNQTTGTSEKLSGATFAAYRYVGDVKLNASTINGGSIDLANPTSFQWAPVTGNQGEEGAAGSGVQPYSFVSAAGDEAGLVNLTGLMPGVWYMLVETSAPAGYQMPAGQWAFKVNETTIGSGTYAIDVHTLLARRGSDGSLPPAFATSITTTVGVQTGLFLPNTPVFDLPFAGSAPWLPFVVVIAGGFIVMLSFWLRLRGRADQ